MPLLRRLPPPLELIQANGHQATNGHRPAGPWGTSHDGKRQQRALLAAATNISNGSTVNRTEAARIKKLKQAWQEDAWAYRDSVGELRYATTFLGNALRKIKLYPAAYVEGELDPLPLEEIKECPANILEAANDALARLGANPLAMAGLLRDTAENFEVAGECHLLGWPPNTKDGNDEELWEIRSISEITSNTEGEVLLKEYGESGTGKVLPNNVFYSRLWYPHPRRRVLADSPFAAILDIAEELLILSRDIRAAGRSRLANSGILLLPDTLTVVKSSMTEDANDDEQDAFMQELVAAAMTAIQDEGSAAAIVPIIARGPRDDLAAVRQVTISRPDAQNAQKRTELIERMATAIDLPAEVLTGKADLNHWTAWSISDDTFSDHVEPLVMVMDDAFTAGYLKIVLKATPGLDPDWVNKVLLWHDATRLVRHPDRSQDALQAYDRFALSQAALRETMGFSDSDKPTEVEILERLATKQNRLDPSIVSQIIHRMDNSIDVSAVAPAPGGGAKPAPSGGPSAVVPPSPAEGPPQGGQPQQESSAPPPAPGPQSAVAGGFPKDQALVAATVPPHIKQGNAKMAQIESELTAKVQTAANAAMARALERAGARIRTNVSKTASGRAWCASHKNIELPFIISHSMIAAAGLDEQNLLKGSWEQLKTEWQTYIESSDSQALNTVAKMLKIDPDKLADVADTMQEYSDSAWTWLENRLNQIATGYLKDSASLAGEAEEITTTQLISWSDIKQALARAGGQPTAESPGVAMGDSDPTTVTPMTGITNGPVISNVLGDNGLTIGSYTWIHGYTPNPFQPHVDLDGIEFSNWEDEVLTNNEAFPDRDYYMPGDHDGCSCDFQVNWSAPEESEVASGFGGPGSGPRPGKGKGEKLPPKSPEVIRAMDAGMARQTAVRLEGEGKLDDALKLSEKLAPQEQIDQARADATAKNAAAEEQITPEDKARAEARHAASGRAGGDDRPGHPTRVRLAAGLVNEFGDGKTCPCIWCGRTLVPDTTSLDRLVPGSEGGPYKAFNLAPSCYDCNNWRSNTSFSDAMDSALAAEKAPMAASLVAAADHDKPIVPLGTWVTAKCIGYAASDNDPAAPTGIPLEEVEGKLDGYYVGTFGYFKYIVCGYDVIADTIKITQEPTDEAITAGGPGSGPHGHKDQERTPSRGAKRWVSEDGTAGTKYLKSSLGATNPSKLGGDHYAWREQVAKDLCATPEMQSHTPDEIYAAASTTQESISLNNYNSAMANDGYISKDIFGHILEVDSSNPNAVKASSPEGQDLARSSAVVEMMNRWAGTSNDTNPTSLAIQQSAADTFGIQNAAAWNTDQGTQAQVDQLMNDHGQVYKDFLQAQYNNTQAQFKADGVKQLELYRGYVGTDIARDQTNITVQTRPLSSWSTDPQMASKFGGRSNQGVMMQATVPVENVLSTAMTGLGMNVEQEVVLRTGSVDVNATAKPYSMKVGDSPSGMVLK